MAKVCGRCGSSVGENDKFCIACGANLEEVKTKEAPREYTEAGGTWQKEQPVQENAHFKEPLTFSNYLLMFFVVAIPVVNLVFLLIWAFSKKENINRKNFSRAALIYVFVTSVISILCAIWLCLMTIGLMSTNYSDEFYDHMEETIPHNRKEQFFPEPQNDIIITFTSAEERVSNIEISKSGVVMV